MRAIKQLAQRQLKVAVIALALGLPLAVLAERSLNLTFTFPQVTDAQQAAYLTQAILDQFPNKTKYTVSATNNTSGTIINLIKHGIYDVYWPGNSSSQTCSTNNPDWTISKGVPETFTIQCSQGDGHTDFINTITLNLVTPQNPKPSITIVTHDTFRHQDQPRTYACSVGRGTRGLSNINYEDTKKLYWFSGINNNGYLRPGGEGCSFPVVQ